MPEYSPEKPYSGVSVPSAPQIKIIGVPLDLGASRRGVDMGPSAVRVAGLETRLESLGHEVKDGGNIRVAMAETEAVGEEHAQYLKRSPKPAPKPPSWSRRHSKQA